MKRFSSGGSGPKYQSGKWSWDKKTESLHFEKYKDLSDDKERYIETNGFKFLRTINPEEELIFIQKFLRSKSTYDSDTVVSYDVLDLVKFLMPKEFLSKKFIIFLHQPSVQSLIRALTIYFDYFLKLVEFVLIRRDELAGDMGQIQSEQTNEMKRIFSTYLSQYRMLVARNYSEILKGEGDMAPFYHMKNCINISSTIKDKLFHEQFLACAIQIVWITMHRRAYHVIEMEMNRLFCSEHFVLNRPEYLKFTKAERSLLYGRNHKIVNYRMQVSPLVQELEHVAKEDLPILWIGERRYRGEDIRIATIDLEYIVPGSQLHLIDVSRGILGHPRRLYDTMLNLDWSAVRKENFSLEHDPYQILQQPYLKIPNIDEAKIRKMSKQYEHFFQIFRIYQPVKTRLVNKWLQRDKIVNQAIGDVTVDIYRRCEAEINTPTFGSRVNKIVDSYSRNISRHRKRESNVSTATIVTIPRTSYVDHFFDECSDDSIDS